MVENSQDEPPSPRKVDWSALYERWLRRESPARLAEAFNITEATVIERCRWMDNAMPAHAPALVRRRCLARLHEAEAALDEETPLEAERRAKALIALIRAARALQDWSQPEPAAGAAQETRGEPFDPKAELKRVLLERFNEGGAGQEDRPAVQARSVRGAGRE